MSLSACRTSAPQFECTHAQKGKGVCSNRDPVRSLHRFVFFLRSLPLTHEYICQIIPIYKLLRSVGDLMQNRMHVGLRSCFRASAVRHTATRQRTAQNVHRQISQMSLRGLSTAPPATKIEKLVLDTIKGSATSSNRQLQRWLTIDCTHRRQDPCHSHHTCRCACLIPLKATTPIHPIRCLGQKVTSSRVLRSARCSAK